jgi:hypothetical protein
VGRISARATSGLCAGSTRWNTLEHALRLLFLCAEKDPIKYERAALRWLGRYVTEGKGVSLLKAQLALAALSELRAGSREAAAKLLTELMRR